MKKNIFREYDIRGIYPEEINEETAFKIGQAFVKYTKAKKVAVGYDARLSSKKIFDNLSKGIISQRADVFSIGEMPTECLYFAVGNHDYDSGVMITASHNPKEYNGFKMIRKKENKPWVVRGKYLLPLIEKNDFIESQVKGKIEEINIINHYIEKILSFVDTGKIKRKKVVFDAGNGVAGKVLKHLLPKIPLIKPIFLNINPDGNFPSRSPNPLEKGAADEIKEKIREIKADFGFIFDGDGDRIFLISEKGEMIRADITLSMLSKYFLDKKPGASIVYNLICSKSVPEFIEKWGGKPIRSSVGFVNIWQEMKNNEAILGGEVSAHYSFKDNFYSDSSSVALLILLEILSESEETVSEKAAKLNPYTKEPEINLKVENKEEVIRKIKEKFSDGKKDELDGLTVWYKDWWFNARKSNTEPLLRINIEADDHNLLKEKKEKLISFIRGLN